MNVYDFERIAGLLDEAGYAPVADGAQPDVVAFSTCAVLTEPLDSVTDLTVAAVDYVPGAKTNLSQRSRATLVRVPPPHWGALPE